MRMSCDRPRRGSVLPGICDGAGTASARVVVAWVEVVETDAVGAPVADGAQETGSAASTIALTASEEGARKMPSSRGWMR